MRLTQEHIARKLRALRKAQGLTTAELGKRIGISQSQVRRLERGAQGFRYATLNKFADALDVHPLYFFLEEGDAYGLLIGGDLRKALLLGIGPRDVIVTKGPIPECESRTPPRVRSSRPGIECAAASALLPSLEAAPQLERQRSD